MRLEAELDHRLLWHICMLHTNELPLRHLMTELDGPTTGKDSFKGPIGRAAKEADSLPPAEFDPIPVEVPIHKIPDDVKKDLSTDQKYLYEVNDAIRSGSVPSKLYTEKIGPMDHARWVTLANRIQRLYISKHSLTGIAKRNLKIIVTFIVTHYTPMWFEIKCKPSYKDGPSHVLTSVKLFKYLSEDTKSIVEPTIRRNAYFAHSENILMAMVADTDQEKRKKAVQIIEKIRQGDIFGDESIRPFKVPTINFDAEEYDALIDWDGMVHEPIVTAEMGIFNIQKIEHQRLFIGNFKCHTQAIERTVKEVTKASKAVVGQARRDGVIKSTLKSRALHPESNTKKHLVNMMKDDESSSSDED